jgi:signal transduction histidine kinase/DNA-directed RNA polymerase subunit N (RpoN/RPB10)
MAMHRSEELSETAAVLFQEFKKLGEEDLLQITFGIYHEAEGIMEFHVTSWAGGGAQVNRTFNLSIEEPTLLKPAFTAWKQQKKSLVVDLTGKKLEGWLKYRNANVGVTVRSEDTHGRRVVTIAFFSKGHVSISSPEPKSPETIQLLERFAGVFDLTYTRFLDLKNAEAQTRESQIELGLERVRARAMAMQNSDELKELIGTVFTELTKLDLALTRCIIWVFEPATSAARWWMANSEEPSNPISFYIKYHEHPAYLTFVREWKKQNVKFVYDLNGADKIAWDDILFNETELKQLPDVVKNGMKAPERVLLSASFNNFGGINVASLEPLSDEHFDLLLRFAKVFDLTYTRFNDLQKAEAQAREAQIELGLERVRARAMAMQKSDELAELVDTVFKELTKLHFTLDRCIIIIVDEKSMSANYWMANPESKTPASYHVQLQGIPYLDFTFSVWKERKTKVVYDLKGEEKTASVEYIFSKTELKNLPDLVKEGMKNTDRIFLNSSFNNFGSLQADTIEPISEDNLDIIYRFAKVFDLTYTRFNDLQKAEAQAREAQIELGLERVRARAMAMHNSEGLYDTAEILYKELSKLGIESSSSGFGLVDEKANCVSFYGINPADGKIIRYANRVPIIKQSKPIQSFFSSWKKQETSHIIELNKKETLEHETFVAKCALASFKEYGIEAPFTIEDWLANSPKEVKLHFFNFQQGCIYIIRDKRLTDVQQEMVVRFTKVFQLTYTRFLDLQKAEAQAREAQIELGLERVRARAMAMQKSDELKELVSTVSVELGKLDIVLDRCFIVIYDVNTSGATWWMSNPETPSEPMGLFVKYHEYPPYLAHLKAWQERKLKWQYILEGDNKKNWDKFLFVETELSMLPDFVIAEMRGNEKVYLSSSFNNFGYLSLATLQPLSDEHFDILLRFAKVFDLTYTRFNDLQKAEAQTREAEIELGLERVRARAMAMQKSDELSDLVDTVFKELTKLDFALNWCIINIIDEPSLTNMVWAANPETNKPPESYLMKFEDYPFHHSMLKGYQERKTKHVYVIEGEEKKTYDKYLFNETEWRRVPKAAQDASRAMKRYVATFTFSNFGGLQTVGEEYLSEENLDILSRFGKVFDLTYTRFNDLKLAEAQAREAQIQLALERVRARTMAMQRSEELPETSLVLYEQFKQLGEPAEQLTIGVVHEENNVMEISATLHGDVLNKIYWHSIDEPFMMNKVYQAWKTHQKTLIVELKGDQLNAYNKYRNELTKSEMFPTDFNDEHRRIVYVAFFSKGMLAFAANEPRPPQSLELLERFASVFDLTYTRFLDLKKAEAQARESQIEASLERVRSKTMAMHNSDDVGETVAALFDELVKLGVHTNRCGILICSESKTHVEVWTAKSNPSGNAILITGQLELNMHPLIVGFYQSWKNKKEVFTYTLNGDDIVSYYKAINNSKYYPTQFDLDKLPQQEIHTDFYFAEGAIFAFTSESIAEEAAAIFKRFAKVFGQTYRRYLDLQKAEAQAREARIEASLERVRAKAMSMHNSQDLSETVNVFFKELKTLGITPLRCGVGVVDETERTSALSATTASKQGDSYEIIGKLNLAGHAVLDTIFEHWKLQQEYYPVLKGAEIKPYYEAMNPHVRIPDHPDHEAQYGSYFYFPEGLVFAWTEKGLTDEEIKIFRRFTSVISLTYRRYMELQKSETNAREAVKQASLDRIRADIASMRTVSDLQRITPLIWDELTIIGIPFIRCGVFIMDESQKLIHTFLSTPDGKAIGAFHLPYTTPGNIQLVLNNWRQKKNYVDHWNEDSFIEFADILMKQGAISSPDQYLSGIPHGGFYLHFLPFFQGMLYVGNTTKLNEDEIKLIQSVADAFSTAYARYEDFNKLEAAKEQIENTLTNLKLAQAQLIQSEKMASLGELTAGIAHEIQNPLNFVNNFSDVSTELIDEMNEEIAKGNLDDARQIAGDLKQNLEKINHHGKRAGDIVKGMLQHSRSSNATKEPTDINKLADEYLRLAYHGLRAKDKTFNATMKTEFDESIGKISVIPQDIGRVILNLITNAFYVVAEKKKQNIAGYEPTISVSTKKEKDKIEIKVKDNGNGIPQKVLDKIFQPFFTTKPTGQGTGLGLSLSYDIVKAHGGELKVGTKEGEGSKFIISLPV